MPLFPANPRALFWKRRHFCRPPWGSPVETLKHHQVGWDRSVIRFKVEAHIPHFYFSGGLLLLWRGRNRSLHKHALLQKEFILSSSTLYFCKMVREGTSSWAISGQGRITRTNYQPESKSVNIFICCFMEDPNETMVMSPRNLQQQRAGREKTVKSSYIKMTKKKMIYQSC